MKGQAAIFDLDGTLLDSTDVWHRIDRAFLARRGLGLPADYSRAVAAMHLHEAALYTVERFGLDEQPGDVVAEWLAMAKEAYAHQISLKPGAMAFLTRLRERGVRLAVATSLARELAVSALQRHGIYDWFETVVYAADVGQGKSSPAVFLRVAAQLGVEPSACTVFEDTLVGVRSAKAAGMRVFSVADPGSAAQQDAICAVADGFFANWECARIV